MQWFVGDDENRGVSFYYLGTITVTRKNNVGRGVKIKVSW